jgi:hypothetical protein
MNPAQLPDRRLTAKHDISTDNAIFWSCEISEELRIEKLVSEVN